MLANGPPWMNAGVFSSVCTRFGASASFKSTLIGPAACRSAACTGARPRVWPTTIRPRRASRSFRSRARQKIAITSEATVMSKPSSRGKPFAAPPSAHTIERSARSFMSITRRHAMRRVSRSSSLPQYTWLSISAESRLCATPMA